MPVEQMRAADTCCAPGWRRPVSPGYRAAKRKRISSSIGVPIAARLPIDGQRSFLLFAKNLPRRQPTRRPSTLGGLS